MSAVVYNKSIDELRKAAVNYWPDFLSDEEGTSSIIPNLIRTQDKFLSILTLADDGDMGKISSLIRASGFPANLFLKHLVVLADFGGEPLQRLERNFSTIFTKNGKKFGFKYAWNEKEFSYEFKTLPGKKLGNKPLGIDGPALSVNRGMNDLYEDVIAILMFGAAALDVKRPEVLFKCQIGTLLGRKDELDKYVKEKYIWVSRITGGAEANTLGQIAQTYVVNYLKKKLGAAYDIKRNGTIKLAATGQDPTFDIVVSKGKKSVGIEISFQVTTNSTIERKGKLAKERQREMHKKGNYVAYVIDGAGNFQRSAAISTICKHSDCTVAYSQKEFDLLAAFIIDKL